MPDQEKKVEDAKGEEVSPTLPQVEQPKKEEVKPSTEDGFAKIKSMLESQDLKSPDDIQALLDELPLYKKKYGQSQNEVGELRKQLTDLQNYVQQLTQNASPNVDEFGNPQVDIKKEVVTAMNSWWGNIQANAARANQFFAEQRADVESRANWKNVQPYFENAIKNPGVVQAIQQGKMTMADLYSRLNEKLLMTEIDTFVKQIPEEMRFKGTQGFTTADNVRMDAPVDAQRREKIEKAKANQDIDGVLAGLIDEKDPLLRY